MNAHKPVTVNLANLETTLKRFNLYTAHTVRDDKEVVQAIEQAKNLIDTMIEKNKSIPQELTFICKQVAIYYLFYVRDLELAPRYVAYYKNLTVENTIDYAEACNFLGHAKDIDPKYQQTAEFETALQIYQGYKDEASLTGQAFAYRYLALMHHRQNLITEAKALIQKAIDIERSLVEQNLGEMSELMKIALAESLHIQGVILHNFTIQMLNLSNIVGPIGKDSDVFKDAEEKLLAAAALEKEFCDYTKHDHFLKFITPQSLANTWVQMHQGERAVEILREAYEGQKAYYKTAVHADIGKTLHFMGVAYQSLQQYEKALDWYLNAVVVKQKLFDENHPIVQATIKAMNNTFKQLSDQNKIDDLIHAYNTNFAFDWDNDQTFKTSEEKAEKTTAFIKFILPQLPLLVINATQALGELCFKLGTFNNHIKRNADQALTTLVSAETLLTADEDLAWNKNHLAYCYQQKMFVAIKQKQGQDEKVILEYFNNTMNYTNQVINAYQAQKDAPYVTLVAFAHCVKALAYYEMAKWYPLLINKIEHYQFAIASYNDAFKLYKSIDLINLQYARALNRLAMIHDEFSVLLAKEQHLDAANQHKQQANSMFEQAVSVLQQNDPSSVYAARIYASYADFLAKSRDLTDLKKAVSFYADAHKILLQTEEDSEFTKTIDSRLSTVQSSIARRTNEFLPQPQPSATTIQPLSQQQQYSRRYT